MDQNEILDMEFLRQSVRSIVRQAYEKLGFQETEDLVDEAYMQAVDEAQKKGEILD